MASNSFPFLVNSYDHVDEVGIWDHALSDSEVSTLYQNVTSPVPEPATIALLGIGPGWIGRRILEEEVEEILDCMLTIED